MGHSCHTVILQQKAMVPKAGGEEGEIPEEEGGLWGKEGSSGSKIPSPLSL